MSQSRDGPHGSEHDFILGPINHAPVCDTNWRMLPPLAYEQPVAPRQLLDQTPRPQQGCSPPGLGPGVRQRQGCDLAALEADTPYYAHDVGSSSPRAMIRRGKQQTGTFPDPKPLHLSPLRYEEAPRKGRSPIRRTSQRSSLGKRRRRGGSTPNARRNASKNGAPGLSARPRINSPSRGAQMLCQNIRVAWSESEIRAMHALILADFRSFGIRICAEMQRDGFPGRSSAEYMQHAQRLQITDGSKSPEEYPRFGGDARPACVPWATGEERHLRNVICFVQSSVWYRVQENMTCSGFPRRAISEYMRQYNSRLCSNGDAAFGCSLVGETQDTQRPAFF